MGAALAPLEGKYEILAKIKEGGMGAIYKVRHRLLDEVRVVKVLRQQFEDDTELHQRFIHEARSAIRLRHPNVVQIFDFLIEGGQGYIVMEYIDGVDLSELIQRRNRPSLPLFLEIARQALKALGYLHQQGFVHRDISPDNLMLCADFAGRPLVKMIDLGIAKKLDGGENLTESGMFLGKFRYSSPEHFGSQGAGGIEPRSDLYSYGVVLYEFLTGCYPIQGEEPSQLIAGHLFHPPMTFEEADPDGRVPKVLREVVLRMLDKDPDRRFASAMDLAGALEGLLTQFPVTPDTLEEAEGARRLRAADKPAEPGSTQNRLDLGFVHPTPAPVTVPQTEALLSDAEALFKLRQPVEARQQLEAVLRTQPDHPRGLELLREIDGQLVVAGDETVPWSETVPPGEMLPGKISDPSPDEKFFDQHLHAACALAEEGNYAEAVPHFEAALKARDDNEAVRHMLSEAREKLEEEHRASQERLGIEVQQLRDALVAGELEKARERWVSARRAYGDAPSLREVQREIEAAEAREQVREIERTLGEVVQQRGAGQLTQAVQTLESARESWRVSSIRGSDTGQEVLARLDAEEVVLEKAHREAAELDEMLFEVESLISQEKLVEADRVLFQALEAFGKHPELARLRERLDEVHHRGLAREVDAVVEQAVRLTESGAFSEARKALEKARVMAPQSSEILRRIGDCEKDVESARLASKKQAVRQVRGEVEELIDGQNLEQAQARLAAAEVELGELPPDLVEDLEILRLRITDGFQERVNALIHEAGVALEAGRYSAALPFLEQALELSPGDDWIKDRLEQARAALA